MTTRRIVLVLCGAVLLMAAAVATESRMAGEPVLTQEMIGLIDQSQLMTKYPPYAQLMKDLQQYKAVLTNYWNYLSSQYQSDINDLAKTRAVEIEGKTAEEINQITASYTQKAADKYKAYTQLYQDKQKEYQKNLDTRKVTIDQKINAVVQTICKEKNLALVINKTTFYVGGIDITDYVINGN